MGKEAGLFVPSGTMGNLAAILAHCGRGDEVILGSSAHTFLFEAGGISALGGVHSCQIPNQQDGTLDLEAIQSAIRPDDEHQPVTRLITLENTHNRCGGVPLSVAYTQAVGELAHAHNLKLHMDGARIFNAAAALGLSAQELVDPADSVTFCLSKGLCAPVGSVICGSRDFITRAHRVRKQLGGGMRQAGVLATAGIIALETIANRLDEDHIRAQRLAEGLSEIPGIVLDPGTPFTNMIYCSLGEDVPLDSGQAGALLVEHKVRVGIVGPRRFRIVTHYWIRDAEVEQAIAAFKEVLANV
jgi:threonine aldolase